MKKLLMLLSLFATIFSACGNDDEPYRMPLEEFPPIKLIFTYTDENGKDMLDPSNQQNVLNGEVSVTFKGNKYELNKPYSINPNGDGAEHINFQGLKLQPLENGKYGLIFGDLDGSLYYRDEKLALHWGNGRGLTLSIYSIWTFSNNGLPDFYRKYTLAGNVIAENTANPIINDIYENIGLN